jgi:hypothetical protein
MLNMTRAELRAALNSCGDGEFVDRELLGRRPWIFETAEIYRAWQVSVAKEIDVVPDNIRIVGSAATGYSLSPLKPGRAFRRLKTSNEQTSDIDIALVAPSLFVAAWETIVYLDRSRRLGVGFEMVSKIRLDIYWGLVALHSLPLNTDPARSVAGAMNVAGRMPPLRGYPIRCRVYRRVEDLRAYHVNSVRQLRQELSAYGG